MPNPTHNPVPTAPGADAGESPLVRLMRTWERLGTWGEQELWLQLGDDLCSVGRYLTAQTFYEDVCIEFGEDICKEPAPVTAPGAQEARGGAS